MKLKLLLFAPTLWSIYISAMEEDQQPQPRITINRNTSWISNTDAGRFDGGLPLHQASAEGKIIKVKELLAKGADVNERNECGRVALHGAIRFGKYDIVDLLLTQTPKVNMQGFVRKQTPLHVLAQSGSKEFFITFLQLGGDVTIQDTRGHTPLVCAACFGNLPVIKVIIGYADLPPLLLKDTEAAVSKKRILAFMCCLKKNKIEVAKNMLAYIFSFLPDAVSSLELTSFINQHGCPESKCHVATGRRIVQLTCLLNIVDKKNLSPWQFAKERNKKEIANLLNPETFSDTWYNYLYKREIEKSKTNIEIIKNT